MTPRSFFVIVTGILMNILVPCLGQTYTSSQTIPWIASSSSPNETSQWSCRDAGCNITATYEITNLCQGTLDLTVSFLPTDFPIDNFSSSATASVFMSRVSTQTPLFSTTCRGLGQNNGPLSWDQALTCARHAHLNKNVLHLPFNATSSVVIDMSISPSVDCCGHPTGLVDYRLGAQIEFVCEIPVSCAPSHFPTRTPTAEPTIPPTATPTNEPSSTPTMPSNSPTSAPVVLPRLTVARFSADFANIYLSFSLATNHAGVPYGAQFDCAQALSLDTSSKLGYNTPFVICEFVNSTLMRITLGSTPTIVPNQDNITMLEDASSLVKDVTDSITVHGSALLLDPETPTRTLMSFVGSPKNVSVSLRCQSTNCFVDKTIVIYPACPRGILFLQYFDLAADPVPDFVDFFVLHGSTFEKIRTCAGSGARVWTSCGSFKLHGNGGVVDLTRFSELTVGAQAQVTSVGGTTYTTVAHATLQCSEVVITSDPTTVPSTTLPTRNPITPTMTPTLRPSNQPTATPSYGPTITPTHFPSNLPTNVPTNGPTSVPTIGPTTNGTLVSAQQLAERPAMTALATWLVIGGLLMCCITVLTCGCGIKRCQDQEKTASQILKADNTYKRSCCEDVCCC